MALALAAVSAPLELFSDESVKLLSLCGWGCSIIHVANSLIPWADTTLSVPEAHQYNIQSILCSPLTKVGHESGMENQTFIS